MFIIKENAFVMFFVFNLNVSNKFYSILKFILFVFKFCIICNDDLMAIVN